MSIEHLIAKIIQFEKRKEYIQMKETIDLLEKQASATNHIEALCASAYYEAIYLNAMNLHEESIQHFYTAIQYAKQGELYWYKMKCHNELGNVFACIADYFSALKQFLKAYRVANSNDSFHFKHIILNNIGSLFVWLDEFKTATYYFNEAYEMYMEYDCYDEVLLETILVNLCEATCYYNDNGRFEYLYRFHEDHVTKPNKRVIEALRILKDVRRHYVNQSNEFIAPLVLQFIEASEKTSQPAYFYRGFVELFEICIKIGDEATAKNIQLHLDEINHPMRMLAFDFRLSKLRVDFYRAFVPDGSHEKCLVYEDYFLKSSDYASLFHKTYVQNVMVSLELDHFKSEVHSAYKENQVLQKEIEKDSFTNLLNKVYAKKYVNSMLQQRKVDTSQALILFDIDKFKEVNDLYGHQFGDEVILRSARLVETFMNKDTILARFGGDEFFVFLSDVTSLSDLKAMVQQLLQIGRKIFFPNDVEKYQTYSIGVAFIQSSLTFDEAFAIADRALYYAKEAGRNQAVIMLNEEIIAMIKGIESKQ